MAMNPYNSYDPYIGEVPQQVMQDAASVGSIARDAINPLNWVKWKYQYDPTTYGGLGLSKGLWTPFGKNISSTGGMKGLFTGKNTIFDTYKSIYSKSAEKGFGSIYNAINQTFRQRIGGASRIGADIVPAGRKAAKNSRIFKRQIEKDISRRIKGSAGYRIGKQMGAELEDMIILHNGRIPKDVLENYITAKSKSELVSKAGLAPEKFSRIARTTSLAGQDTARKLGIHKATGAGLKSAGMRIGMLAGKAFAAYGLVSTMWDLTKMAGEPIGRYLIENANRVATEIGQKYSPEMGGKIAMSYMTTGAATERQRAVEAISRSYINGRSALGNEAQYLHG